MKKLLTLVLVVAMLLTSGFAALGEETKTLYTNTGPLEFYFHPWFNPGQYVTQKVIWDTLIAGDANMNPAEGAMATEYGFNEEGDVLTFVLREGMTWHDGEPVTAEDVKWSIEYSLKTGLLNSVFQGTFRALEGFDAYMNGEADEITGIVIDGNTISLKFVAVAPDALLTFCQYPILPKHCLENDDPAMLQQSAYFQSPIGSGPFKVKETKIGSYCVLEPFEDYYGGVADFEIYCAASSAEADENLVVNATAGNLDYAYSKTYTDVQALRQVEGLTVHTVDVKYTRLFWINKYPYADGTPSPLADVRVRQAIAYAIDMDTICETIFEGSAIPADAMAPNGGSKVEGLNPYKYDPDKARELLAEAGWDSSKVLDVVYYYQDQQTVDLMAIIQSYLADVGIQINARLITGDTDSQLWSKPEDVENGPRAVEWDMAYAAVAAMSLHEYYDRLYSATAVNSHTPKVPELDALIEATNASMDADVQQAAFFELEKYENENLPEIPLYYTPVWVVTSEKLKGVFDGFETIGNPQYRWNWDIQNWDF